MTLVDLGAVLTSEGGGGGGGVGAPRDGAAHALQTVSVRPSRASEHAPGYAPSANEPRFVLAPNMGSTVDARAVRALLAAPRADAGRTLGGDGKMAGATEQALERASKTAATSGAAQQRVIRNLVREPDARPTSSQVGTESFTPVSLAEALRVRSWLQRLGLGELLPGNAALEMHSLESSLLNGVLLCALARTLAPETPPLGGTSAATRRRPFLRPTCFAEARANVEAALDVFRVFFSSAAAGGSGITGDSTPLEGGGAGSPRKTHSNTIPSHGNLPQKYLFCGEEIAVGGNTDAAWGLLAHIAAACAWHDITAASTSTTSASKRPITPLRARAPASAARQGALIAWLASTTALERAGVPGDAAALGGDVGSLDPVLAQLCDGTILCALATAAGGSIRGAVPAPRTRAIAAANIEKGLSALRALPHMPLRTLASPSLPADIFAGKLGPLCDVLEEIASYWDAHVAVDGGRAWKEVAREKGWTTLAALPAPRAVPQSLPSTPGTRSPRSRTPSAPATPQLHNTYVQSTPPRGPGRVGGGDLDSSFTRSAPPSPRPPTVAPLVRVPARSETPLSPLVAVTERVLRDAAMADAVRAAETAARAAVIEDAPKLSDALCATLSRLDAVEGAPLPVATLAAWFRALKITVHDPAALAHDDGRAREWEDGRLLCDLVCAVTREAVPGADARRAPPRTAAAKTANVRRALEVLRKEHDMPLDLLWAEREILGGSAPVLRRLLTQIKRHVKR